jgi:thymidylate synthase (FAD)
MTEDTANNDRMHVLNKGYVRLIDHMGDDLSIVNAARVSYAKESKEFNDKDRNLLEFLAREGHTSPFRHAAITFEIYAPLMVVRQWNKHQVASTFLDDLNGWNESSRRYVTEDEEFYIPEYNEWRSAPENSKQGSGEPIDVTLGDALTERLIEYTNEGILMYQSALYNGVAPEQARLFLPSNGLYVRSRWTVSLAAVLHFISLRYAHDSQKEIQLYAQAVADYVKRLFPESYKLFIEE